MQVVDCSVSVQELDWSAFALVPVSDCRGGFLGSANPDWLDFSNHCLGKWVVVHQCTEKATVAHLYREMLLGF